MSGLGGISGNSDYSQLQSLLTDNTGIRQQLSIAQAQASTGVISQTYAGLGPIGARTSLALQPQIAHEQTWQATLDSASGRIDATQTALTSINSIVTGIYAQAASLSSLSPSTPAIVAHLAQQGLEQVANLLNTKVGDVYVFAGADSGNPPIPDTSSATLTPALLTSDTSIAPFSATLGTTPSTFQVGAGQSVQVGLLANKNTLAASKAPTTGSYMRDILKGLASLSTVTDGPTLLSTAASAKQLLGGAISTMATETGSLGNIQADLKNRKTQSAATVLNLQTQISNIQDVDMAATLSRVTNLQTQLQSSYQIIASLKEFSLSKYI